MAGLGRLYMAARDWEKLHVPNMTGTSQAYRPPGSLVREGDTVKVINEPGVKELKFVSLGENVEPPAEAITAADAPADPVRRPSRDHRAAS